MKARRDANVKTRSARLKTAGVSRVAVARLAGVSDRMVRYVLAGRKRSLRVDRAIDLLTQGQKSPARAS